MSSVTLNRREQLHISQLGWTKRRQNITKVKQSILHSIQLAIYFKDTLCTEMAHARDTISQFHEKNKTRSVLTEQSSVDQLTSERDLHDQSLQALQRELEESRQKLAHLTRDYQLQLQAANQKLSTPIIQMYDTSHQDTETKATKFNLPERYL